MIDALLSDRPDDRRELFEEAAGVGLYRDRRRNTERRLEETTQDLPRLDDLIGEVQSQVRSLSRQRKRAERHTELMERRFAVELTLAVARHGVVARGAGPARGARGRAARRPFHNSKNARARPRTTRDAAHRDRSACDAQRNELARQASAVRESVQALRAEIAVAGERHRNAMERRQRAEDERRERSDAESRLERDLASASAECAESERQLVAAEEDSAARTADESEAREAVRLAREGAEESERDVSSGARPDADARRRS